MKISKHSIAAGAGNRLSTFRKGLNLTPKQMAARLDVKLGTYYKNENGESRPGWVSLYILQRDYDISVDWLMMNKGPKYIREKVPNMSQIQAERTKEKQLLNQTTKLLKETQEETKHFLALKKIAPDVENLMEHMINDPELRYDILLKFHRHQKDASGG